MPAKGPTLVIVGIKGLGREVALHFARRGWNVVCASRTRADVEAVAAAVEIAGGGGLPVVCDIADTNACRDLVAKAIEHFGRVDLCVASQTSGARFGPVPVLEVAEDDLRRSFFGYPVNTLHLLQAVGQQQTAQGGGAFIQMGTSSGLRTREGFAALGAAQHALRALIQVAARELRPALVHVAYLAIEGGITSEKRGGDKTIPAEEVARAVEYLYAQDPRSWTHEMSIKPALADWAE